MAASRCLGNRKEAVLIQLCRSRRGGTASFLAIAGLACALLLPQAASAYSPHPIRHVFVVIDENESASTTFGPASPAPYLSHTLVSQGAYLPHYFGVGHNSLDNYVAMVSGQAPNPDTSGDCHNYVNFPADSMDASGQENGQGCIYPGDVTTLMSQFDGAGPTWRGYMDGMGADPTRESATCGHPPVGAADNTQTATPQDQYATRHDPFVYFHYVIDNHAECNANVVNLASSPSHSLTRDLQSASRTPNYVFVTPNLCDDGHDAHCANGGPGGLAQADSYLRTLVPKITSSPAYKQNGLLIVTFDEASTVDASACCGEQPGPYDAANGIMPGGTGPGGGDVGAVLLSPFIKPGTTSNVSYNHYSTLGSVEDLFGLARIADAQGVAPFGADVFTNPVAGVKLGKAKIRGNKARFSFKGTHGAAKRFQCALIKPAKKHHKKSQASFANCRSPKTYKHLKRGRYRFEVVAVNSAGGISTPAIKKFKVH
jgi:phosphatidylinositol-3-phosphatase